MGELDVERVAALRWGGPLEAEFGEVAERVIFEPMRRTRVGLRMFKGTRTAAVLLEQLAAAQVLLRCRPDVVYLNTVKSACYVRPALALGLPTILHGHELDELATGTLARYRLTRCQHQRLLLVACSRQVQECLAMQAGRELTDVRLVRSLVDTERVRHLARVGGLGAGRRARFVVGACGTADRGKGFDVWLEAAHRVGESQAQLPGRAGVGFRWIGRTDQAAMRAGRDAVSAGLVELVGEMQNPYAMLADLDIFTLPSRRDAFPLVVLEAMALGRPVVATAVGGVPEQVGDAGVLVPSEDPGALAEAISTLLADSPRRAELGERAARRVDEEFGFARFRAGVLEVLDEALQGRRGSART